MRSDETGREVVFYDPDTQDAGVHLVGRFELALHLVFCPEICGFDVGAPMRGGPEGCIEISRWREPPDCGKNACAPAGALEQTAMPSTHLSLHYHIVFSTKERRRLPSLHALPTPPPQCPTNR